MKGVQCYELLGGIALKIHTFSFSFSLVADRRLDDSTSISSDVSDTLADTNADVTLAGSSRNTLLEGKADGDAKRASRMKLRNEPSQQVCVLT